MNVCGVRLPKASVRHTHEHTGHVAIRRDDAAGNARIVEPLVAAVVEPADIAVDDRPGVCVDPSAESPAEGARLRC